MVFVLIPIYDASYLVMVGRKGRMRRGASVWPRKMLAAAFIDSAAVVPTVTYRSHPVVKIISLWSVFFGVWRRMIFVLTYFLNNKLQCSPIVKHAHKEADEVDNGERTKEEWRRDNSHVVDVPQDTLNGLRQFQFSGSVEGLGDEWLTSCQVCEYKVRPLVCVVEKC